MRYVDNKLHCKDIFEDIIKNWNLEAKQEDDKYFYYVDEVNAIENGSKCYVIGRKGMGKTAISEYLSQKERYNIFSEKMTFKNFPYNILYNLADNDYRLPNQYITTWKYIIYNTILKMMAQNNGLKCEIKEVLSNMYPKDAREALKKSLRKWTTKEFGLQILSNGFNYGREEFKEEISWQEKVDIFEEIIEKYIDDSFYYILIDELDEDYKAFINNKEREDYFSLLTSLFKAVQDIRSKFKGKGNIRPVVFLRSDIYSLIHDSDKTKWSEFEIDLTWDKRRLKEMLCHRLVVSTNDRRINERNVWNIVFDRKYIHMGNRGKNKMNNFDYISRSTHLRPRDYVYYIKECAKLALKRNEDVILAQNIKEVDRNFSEYLRKEIVDEIYPVLPNISDVFAIFSQIRKQTFNPKDFISAYTSSYGKTEDEARDILLKLFDHGIIGNQPSMKGQQIFKYQHLEALFNFNENIIIHRGLYKALQIF